MKPNTSIDSLLRITDLNMRRAVEDELAKDHTVTVIRKRSSSLDDYVFHSSLPWYFGGALPKVSLEELWDDPLACRKCPNLVMRHTVPMGNMQPTIFVVGDAPGVGDGAFPDGRFDRMWAYGPSSGVLRRAMRKAGCFYDAWFTNLLRHSTPDNRSSSPKEVEACLMFLRREFMRLDPSVAILLGGHVAERFPYGKIDIPTVRVTHPTWYARGGGTVDAYADEIRRALR